MSPNRRTRTMKKIEAFLLPDSTHVDFVPIADAPGCSHRVYLWLLAGSEMKIVAKDWFCPHPHAKYPSKRAALFYYDKYREGISTALASRTPSTMEVEHHVTAA